MALDITAYRQIAKANAVLNDDGEAVSPNMGAPIGGDYFVCYINPDFPGRGDGLDDRAIYRYVEKLDFRAGSYSGYNWWREQLAKFAGYHKTVRVVRDHEETRHDASAFESDGGSFWELINFADNEGCIGPSTCAKLAKDFKQFKGHPGVEELGERYGLWQKAFEMGADNGCVSFH